MEAILMPKVLSIALIADTFPPLRTSGAVQLRDLSREFARQGHELTVLLPCSNLDTPWKVENTEGLQILRLKAPKTKDIGYMRRTLNEFLMPFFMRWNFNQSPLANTKWDGVVWYAPSIFHGPFANFLKTKSGCKGYLIIRDIFPDWAVDMGLIRRNGLPHRVFQAIARYQYSVADVIGVQTPGNLKYFQAWARKPARKLEVLQNWLGESVHVPCTIRLNKTRLVGRKIFVYAGNMGVAQFMDIVIDLAEKMQPLADVGFVFVGRGSEVEYLQKKAIRLKLNNTMFFDEIHPDEIPDLYSQCSVGIVALHPKHNSHNIPGKFITYMQNGLPVLATINPGNDLAEIIREENVGNVCESGNVNDLEREALSVIQKLEVRNKMSENCKGLYKKLFSVSTAAKQITNSLSSK